MRDEKSRIVAFLYCFVANSLMGGLFASLAGVAAQIPLFGGVKKDAAERKKGKIGKKRKICKKSIAKPKKCVL